MSRMPKVRNESYLKAQVKKALNKHDWFWWMPPTNGFGRSGVSDIHAIKPGLFMVIETKDKGGEITPLQRGFLQTVSAADHFALVVYPDTLDVLETFLTKLNESIQLQAKNLAVPADIGGGMIDALVTLTAPYKT